MGMFDFFTSKTSTRRSWEDVEPSKPINIGNGPGLKSKSPVKESQEVLWQDHEGKELGRLNFGPRTVVPGVGAVVHTSRFKGLVTAVFINYVAKPGDISVKITVRIL